MIKLGENHVLSSWIRDWLTSYKILRLVQRDYVLPSLKSRNTASLPSLKENETGNGKRELRYRLEGKGELDIQYVPQKVSL